MEYQNARKEPESAINLERLRENLVTSALELLGFPSVSYHNPDMGMNPEQGLDCSGFLIYLLEKNGVYIPGSLRHCNQMFDHLGIGVHDTHILPGDFIFFSRNGKHPSHAGIITNPESNLYIHAPGKDGTLVKLTKWQNKLIHPIETEDNLDQQIYSSNPIGFKRITIPDPDNSRWQNWR